MNLKKIWRNVGLRQFVLRSAVFALILGGIFSILLYYLTSTPFFIRYSAIGPEFYIPLLSGLSKTQMINSFLFAAFLFLLLKRRELAKLKAYNQNWPQTAGFATLAILFLAGHYLFKFWIKSNHETAIALLPFAAYGKLVFNLLFIVFLALAIYNWQFIRDFVKAHWKAMVLLAFIGFGYFYVIELFQNVWFFMSTIVATIIAWALSLTFSDVSLVIRGGTTGPIIGIGDFRVAISKDCSGIDSLIFFISLIGVILALDWKRIDKKKLAIAFILGLMGTWLYNIIRVYLIIVIGILISPEFAVNTFHSNVGWIMFLLFFIVYWHFASMWVYKKGLPKQVAKE